ncbi:MAG: hypothetical protein M3537_07155 [Chloroflexota bacterium]|nr:hypothetical protein [Chloroflexota bacterium]
MLSNADYMNQAVSIQSGIDTLTGTITRWSETSIWALLSNGVTYRFLRSQDGQWRIYGHAADPTAAPLVFAPAAVAPVNDPAPVNAAKPVTRIEMDQKQAELVYRIEDVAATATGWDREEAEARAKVADPERSLSSFTIDALTAAAGTAEARHDIASFLAKIAPFVVVSEAHTPANPNRYKILEITDGPALTAVVRLFADIVVNRYERFYKPNSTSVSDVEIKLHAHVAYGRLYRAINGRY